MEMALNFGSASSPFFGSMVKFVVILVLSTGCEKKSGDNAGRVFVSETGKTRALARPEVAGCAELSPVLAAFDEYRLEEADLDL